MLLQWRNLPFSVSEGVTTERRHPRAYSSKSVASLFRLPRGSPAEGAGQSSGYCVGLRAPQIRAPWTRLPSLGGDKGRALLTSRDAAPSPGARCCRTRAGAPGRVISAASASTSMRGSWLRVSIPAASRPLGERLQALKGQGLHPPHPGALCPEGPPPEQRCVWYGLPTCHPGASLALTARLWVQAGVDPGCIVQDRPCVPGVARPQRIESHYSKASPQSSLREAEGADPGP